jgi:hypothetical protein
VKTNALRYYMHDGPTAFRFELAGDLNREGVCRLNQDWRTASSALGDRRLIVDMTFVTGVDQQARALINRWHREGALLIANSAASRALAESILGEPLWEPPVNTRIAAVRDWTWRPIRSSFLWRAVSLLFLAMLLFPVEASAAENPAGARASAGQMHGIPGSLEHRCAFARGPSRAVGIQFALNNCAPACAGTGHKIDWAPEQMERLFATLRA